MIYVDNASTTPIDPLAVETMKRCLDENFGNPSNIYKLGREAKDVVEQARKTIARCINAKPNEIYFTSGGTESINWAIRGICLRKTNPHIITSVFEHSAVLNTCRFLETQGVEITYIPVEKNGIIDVNEVKAAIRPETCLVSVMYANNELGTIQPIEQITYSAYEHHVPMHTDAVQAVGHMDVDVKKMNINLLSASAHKFNGPKGVGFLYIKEGMKLQPLLYGGGQEHHFRSGTENVASILGMAVALEQNIINLKTNEQYLDTLKNTFLEELKKRSIEYNVNGFGKQLSGLTNITLPGLDAEALLQLLDLKEIYLSAGAACNAHKTETSHVLKAIGLSDESAMSSVRVSFGKYNTVADAITLADEILKCSKLMVSRQ